MKLPWWMRLPLLKRRDKLPRLRKAKPKQPPHGTVGRYLMGCRCQRCRRAMGF